MKRFFPFALFAGVVSVAFGQQRAIAAHVEHLHGAGAEAKSYALFTHPTDAGTSAATVVGGATVADLDKLQLQALLAERPAFISIALPYDHRMVVVELYRVEVIPSDFTVRTDRGVFAGYTPGAYYRGMVQGDASSVAAVSFFAGEVIGVVSSPALGNLVVGKVKGTNAQHIIYADAKLLVDRPFSCGTNDGAHATHPSVPAVGGERTDKCVRLYYEVAFGIYQGNNSDVAQSVNWMTAIHNNVATLYANDGINVSLSEVFVWTQAEPFAILDDPTDVYTYANYRTAFNGDVANFIKLGANGFAFGIGQLCTQGAYETSGIFMEYADVPLYSWTVECITHEIGHVLGSEHTHACAWNGNNTQIDDCGNVPYPPLFNIPPGACYDSLNPILPATGTIMSYCGVDLSLGFGEQPAQRIRDHVNAAPCLGSDCATSCTPSIDSILVSEITPYSALLTFHESNPAITQWQVSVLDDSQIMVDWTTITVQSYSINGLYAGHYYEVRLRSACPQPLSNSVVYTRSFVPTTTTCSQHVYDSGGNASPYLGYNTADTYYPDLPSNKVTLTFNAFSIEPGEDFVTIYNGADTNAPALGTFTGSNIPGPFTSTAPGGALTVALVVDGQEFNPYDGWDATLSCAAGSTTGVDERVATDGTFSCYPNPVLDHLTVDYALPSTGRISLEVLDLQGRSVQVVMSGAERSAGAHRESFRLMPMAPGCYVLRLRTDGGTHALRVVLAGR